MAALAGLLSFSGVNHATKSAVLVKHADNRAFLFFECLLVFPSSYLGLFLICFDEDKLEPSDQLCLELKNGIVCCSHRVAQLPLCCFQILPCIVWFDHNW